MSEPAVRYEVRLADVDAHLFEVTLIIATPDPAGQRFAMPAWAPGSYMIREFARHVIEIEARSGGRVVRLAKEDKHTWRAARCRGPLALRYRLYAYDLSVRAAYLDAQRGFLNGPAVLMQPLGQSTGPIEIELVAPVDPRLADWRVATTLERRGSGAGTRSRRGAADAVRSADPVGDFGNFIAQDYDTLLDHPIEFGRFDVVRFEAAGRPHVVAIAGRHDADPGRLAHDLARICTVHGRLFEPRGGVAPFDRYLFLVNAVGDGYGGLEHRSSTALLCRRDDLPHAGLSGLPDGYRGFLGLASHEYFHAWHVKRIRPRALVDADPGTEAYTRLLWVFEGFTSYYDDLALARAGILKPASYLGVLADTARAVLAAPGRRHQSVAESSFDAWIKYYRQDENSPNAIVSYYAKGALVAAAIDLAVRARTGGRRSLDDAMRLLWKQHGREDASGEMPPGLDEDGFPALLEEATGVDLRRELAGWADGTVDPPLAALLAPFGVQVEHRADDDEPPSVGARLATRGGDLVLTTALSGGPAMRAGLSSGDVLVALDGLRIDERSWKRGLSRRAPGDRVTVHAFRRDELMTFDVVLDPPMPNRMQLSIDESAGADAARLRRGWLGSRR